MTFIDLCAGIGGISLGLERAGMRCIAQVEIDAFCNWVLSKHWPDVPRWENVKTCARELPAAELVAGGYPCQPFSYAGKRQGAQDDRHLWPSVFEIVQTVRPAWCLFENVPGHVTLGIDDVLSDLEGIGYACQPIIVPAVSVDAKHRRDRVWIIAHSDGTRLKKQRGSIAGKAEYSSAEFCDFATGWKRWEAEPGVGRVADGVPNRVDRLGGLGNAVVPQVVERIGMCIMEANRGCIYDKPASFQ